MTVYCESPDSTLDWGDEDIKKDNHYTGSYRDRLFAKCTKGATTQPVSVRVFDKSDGDTALGEFMKKESEENPTSSTKKPATHVVFADLTCPESKSPVRREVGDKTRKFTDKRDGKKAIALPFYTNCDLTEYENGGRFTWGKDIHDYQNPGPTRTVG